MADTSDPEIQFREENEAVAEDDQAGGDMVDEREEDDTEVEIIHPREHVGRPAFFDRGDVPRYPHFMGHKGLKMKPEPCSGLEDWEEYLSHFELCAELGRWRAEDKRLALGASLRGSARTFYLSLPREVKENYGQLIEQLGRRFGSERQHNRWLSKLEVRKRLPGESIARLSDDLRQMSQRAYPNLDAVAQEAIALNQLYKCIPLEMKCRCIDKECTTVIQAVEIIERYEAVMGESQEKKKAVPVRGVSGGATGNQQFNNQNRNNGNQRGWNRQQQQNGSNSYLSKALADITARLERIDGRQSQGNRTQNRYGNCFTCDSPDHFYRDCPVYKSRRSNQARQQQATNTTTSDQTTQGNDSPLAH